MTSFALETRDGQRVVVRGRRVAARSADADLTFSVGACELRPGLVNAHDHLYLNHYPRLGEPPYPNMYAWGRDIHARRSDAIARCSTLPREDALRFGALKSLVGGVTAVVHHDRWHPILDESFSVRIARVRVVHSLGFDPDPAAAARGDDATHGRPVSMHLAEGTDALAQGEVLEADRRGLLSPEMVAVHAVGVSSSDVELLRARGCAVVWCPTANLRLYGATAPEALFAGGVDVLLGTDALLTGDGTLLDELRVARSIGAMAPDRLEEAVGATAQRRLGLPAARMREGDVADLIALRRPLGEARGGDVALVIVDGVPRYGDEAFVELFRASGTRMEAISVGGVRKLVEAPLGTVAARVVELTPECGRIFE